ncbi:MAG: hypothetical protein WC859_06990 [Elusimicrobiota bacterium]|jgi:hypothetical protein
MAKKSLGSYYSYSFKMPNIRRQDLAQIEEVILKDLQPQQYHLACHGAVYDRVADIPQDSGVEKTLVVYTHTPCLRLKFARSWAELYVEDHNDQIDPAIRRISAIVSSRERYMLWRFSKFSIWLAPLIGFGGISLTVDMIAQEKLPGTAIYGALGLLGLTVIWWTIGHWSSACRFSRVHLSNE